MNQIYDSLIILTFQVILLIGFIKINKFWLKKSNNIYPIITYWVLGLFFVFLMSSNLYNWILNSTIYEEGSLLRDKDSLNSFASLLAIITYIYIGVTYFKKQII